MNQQKAKKHAHRFAWRVLQQAVDQGKIGICLEAKSDADTVRIEDAYDELIQYHFNRSGDEKGQ